MTPKQASATIWFAVHIFLLLIIGATIIGNQYTMLKMQTDAMDKLNEISVAVNPEDTAADPDATPADPTATYQLTPEERDLVCRVVMSESGGQDLQTQMAVAQTIHDRMADFGETLQDAIRTYSQHDNGEPTDSVRLAVANIFDGNMRVFESGTYQFHDNSVDPYWTAGKIDRGSIGNLRFYGGYE